MRPTHTAWEECDGSTLTGPRTVRTFAPTRTCRYKKQVMDMPVSCHSCSGPIDGNARQSTASFSPVLGLLLLILL